MADRSQRKVVLVAVISSVALLVSGGLCWLVFGVIYSPPGEPVAVADVVPGQAFSAEWIADGYPKRAWLDFDCQGCAFPFRGSAVIEADGRRVAVTDIEVWIGDGYAVSSYEGVGEDSMHGKLLFDVPALPAGARARISGFLHVPSPTVFWSSRPDIPQSPPTFTLLRFWVAR